MFEERGVRHLHDRFFRQQFGSSPGDMISVLRSILPDPLVDWPATGTVEIVDGTFIDDELGERQCDVLLRIRHAEVVKYVYVLSEHQSKSDPLMAYRIHRYMDRIWEHHLAENEGQTRLPAILPVVIYAGEGRWVAPDDLRDVLDLTELPPSAEEFMPHHRFLLLDLTRFDPAELKNWSLTAPARMALVLLMIAPRNPAVGKDLLDWLDDLREVAKRRDAKKRLRGILKYSLEASRAPLETLRPIAAQVGAIAEEALMTTAHEIRIEGRVEGRVEGRAEGEARMLVVMLTHKFGPLSAAYRMRVEAASPQQVEEWCARALQVDSLDDVFDA